MGRWLLAAILLALSGTACVQFQWHDPPGLLAGGFPAGVLMENPALLPAADGESLWLATVDVVDDYFQIAREQRPQIVGDTLTDGVIETRPVTGATLAEPWRRDSVTFDERLESTLQSIRRSAQVRVQRAEGGYLVEVQVEKELEDVERPEHATSGAATLRHDGALDRTRSPLSAEPATLGWISLGRDTLLEQEILARLYDRLAQPVVAGHDIRPLPGW